MWRQTWHSLSRSRACQCMTPNFSGCCGLSSHPADSASTPSKKNISHTSCSLQNAYNHRLCKNTKWRVFIKSYNLSKTRTYGKILTPRALKRQYRPYPLDLMVRNYSITEGFVTGANILMDKLGSSIWPLQ